MSTGLKIALIYMLIMSLIGFSAMGIDKSKAKRNAWRIPEKTLFMITFLGGGAGVWLGMRVWCSNHYFIGIYWRLLCVYTLIFGIENSTIADNDLRIKLEAI